MKPLALISALILICSTLLHFVLMPTPKERAFEAAVAHYEAGNYLQAAEGFTEAEADSLLIGNAYYRAYEAYEADETSHSESENPVTLQKVLSYYEAAILADDLAIEPKYNYEYTLEKIQDQQEQNQDQDQSKQNQSEDQSQEDQSQEGNQDNQDQDSQEGSQDSQDQDSQDNNQGSQNQDSQEGSQDSQNQDSQDNNQGSQNQDSQEGSQDSQDQNAQEGSQGSQDQEGSQNSDSEEASMASGEDTSDASLADTEALYQILELLEQEEEQSLKNNQQMEGNYLQGDDHDW